MADDNQHLKHGKALCGKVFGRFVETFNALVDFMSGLKGDADGKNGEGHITYDRENHIIRCDGCGGKGGGSGVTAAEGSGLTVEDGEIDLAGRGEGDVFSVRDTTLADGSTVKVLRTASEEEKEEEDDEETDDDGHPASDADGDDPDPSDIPDKDNPDFDPEEYVPDGGVPDCGEGGGVSAGDEDDPGGVHEDGDSHSGDGCTAC